jgi:hypothetical protein
LEQGTPLSEIEPGGASAGTIEVEYPCGLQGPSNEGSGVPGGRTHVHLAYGTPAFGQVQIFWPVPSIPQGTQQSTVHGMPLATLAVGVHAPPSAVS